MKRLPGRSKRGSVARWHLLLNEKGSQHAASVQAFGLAVAVQITEYDQQDKAPTYLAIRGSEATSTISQSRRKGAESAPLSPARAQRHVPDPYTEQVYCSCAAKAPSTSRQVPWQICLSCGNGLRSATAPLRLETIANAVQQRSHPSKKGERNICARPAGVVDPTCQKYKPQSTIISATPSQKLDHRCPSDLAF